MTDRDGRIWETEHGPQGGDELNLLTYAGNYGWPLATYGTEYGAEYWPLAATAHDHGSFVEPAYAFMPSIAISNLIEIGGKAFPRWTGDLLVSSLNGRSLWRTRRHGDHVIYSEKIPIGRRIRDLTQDVDGNLVLWTDEGDLVTVTPPLGPQTPAMAYQQCKGCHEETLNGTVAGPNLRGVFGRKVAGGKDFNYSPALRHVNGPWTAEQLDAFLREPKAFVPGTTMMFGGLADSAQRRRVIEFLRTY